MVNLEKLDNILYKKIYIDREYDEARYIWDSIKNNNSILTESIEIIKDKFDEKDVFKATTICEFILRYPNEVNRNIYQELVNKVYSNTDLARIVIDGYSNGGYSFLLYTLMNNDLKLTLEQKNFAMQEALNKIGSENIDYSYLLSDSQAHGQGVYDIRYWILKNKNFNKIEKKIIIFKGYQHDVFWTQTLDEIENNIAGLYSSAGYFVYLGDIIWYTDKDIEKMVGNNNPYLNDIKEETKLVKTLQKIRPIKPSLI